MIYNTEINIYSGASTYTSSNAVRPLFGINAISRFGNYYIKSDTFIALLNKDPNGTTATVDSIYLGKNFYLNKYISFSPYFGYQHLWYGNLYNNAIGGGIKGQIDYNRFYANLHITAMYGFSGTVGYDLKHPGNVYIFYSSLGYKINKQLSIYTYITQERYVNVGSYGSRSLTYRSTGLGLKYCF